MTLLDIQSFSLLVGTSLLAGREMEYIQKSGASSNIILSGRLNAEVTPPPVFRGSRAARYHKLYR